MILGTELRVGLLGTLAFALVGCDPSPRSASWTFVFEDPALESRVAQIEARILEGGCSGEPVYTSLVGLGVTAAQPPVLSPGLVGLAGRARDSDCAWFAEGCTPVMLPQPDGVTTTVLLRASAETPACPGECVAGMCPLPDAGPIDAGFDASDTAVDTGADTSVDTGVEDAVVPVDVSQPDGGCTTASHPDSCADDVLTRCVDGTLEASACSLGCNGTATACAVFVPSNLSTITFTSGLGDITVGAAGRPPVWVFDSDTGEIVGYAAPDRSGTATPIRAAGTGVTAGIRFDIDAQRDGGPDVGVFSMDDLVVQMGAMIIGVGSRPIAFVVRRLVTLDGDILVGADVLVGERGPGPGGAAGGGRSADGSGQGGGEAAVDPGAGPDNGGGGGSYGGPGGDGGRISGTAGSDAGANYGNATLTPLRGGSGGGGGTDAMIGGRGGHGGGAIQITAGIRIEVNMRSDIDACGGGGRGGIVVDGNGGGGGGGGSGGAILLEAPTVMMVGEIGANGGAGGQGARTPTMPGADGPRGTTEMAPVVAQVDTGYGNGGDGSTPGGAASPGGSMSSSSNAGGGGGGGGRVRINNRDGTGRSGYVSRVLPSSSALFTVGMIELR